MNSMKCLSVSSFDMILNLKVENIDISDDESSDSEQREIAERVLEEEHLGCADWAACHWMLFPLADLLCTGS